MPGSAGINLRKILCQSRSKIGNEARGMRLGHSIVPAPEQAKNSASAIRRLLLIERKRPKEIKRAQVPPIIEPRRQYTDDFMRLAVHPDGAANDIASTTKALLPAALTKNNYLVVSRNLFSWKKISAELWLDAENGKKVRTDTHRGHYLGRLARFRQAGVAEGIGSDFTVNLHLATQIKIVSGKDAARWVLWRNAIEPLKLLALRVRQRFQQ